jgi:thiamine kinase-like enzyme
MQLERNTKKSLHNDNRDLISAAVKLAGQMGLSGDVTLEQLAGGRNNQVFKMMVNDQRFLLKSYFVHEADPRERLDNEFTFLRFAWDKGIRCIPQPLTADKKQHVALYEFVEGKRLRESDITDDAIGQAIRFVLELNKYKKTEEAIKLPFASEACFSIKEHFNCVERRLNRLCEIAPCDSVRSNAHDFIQRQLIPRWLMMKNNFSEKLEDSANTINDVIDNNERCLSPSDFGFHNTLLEKNGNLRFVDFEYAGWDDPVKLCSDFICQPELPVSETHGLKFMEEVIISFDQHKAIKQRAERLIPVHRFKWCCILLNEFRTEDRQRRHHAGLDSEHLLEQQLHKTKQYFTKHLTCLA